MSYAPQTPQKALPGSYFQTPAHQSQALSQRGQAVQAGTQKSITEDSQPIDRAKKAVNEALLEESRYPELDNYIGQGISSEYEVSNQPAWAPFQKIRMHTIPDRIFEQYNRAQVSTIMGLFADFNHAWVAIDNALYLWDYTHPNPDLVSFEDASHTITAVRLVAPRPGVFVPSIVRLLVVATTSDIIIVGVSTQPAPHGGKAVSLYSLKMSASVKGLDVDVIEGSNSTGRVFFSGRGSDDVYEFTYQQEEKWFTNRCAKINHTRRGYSTFTPSLLFGQSAQQEIVVQMVMDDSRKLLYTLSSKSTIRTFFVRTNGALDLVITRPLSQTLSNVGHMTSQTDLISPSMSIVSISAITAQEAAKTHLVATTSTGCRLFMSATSSYGYYSSSSNAPTSMQVQHVKFPPAGNSSTGSQQTQSSQSTQVAQYSNVPPINTSSRALIPTRTAVRYAPGYFLTFVTRDPQAGTDLIFISGPDTGRIVQPAQDQQRLIKYPELALWLNLGSRAEDFGLTMGEFAASSSPVGFGNELAVQFDQPSSEIAILTNTGVHILRRRRLVDIFAAVLRLGGGAEGIEGEVKKFIRQYGRDEMTSTALAVACGQAFDVTSDSRLARISDPEVMELARKSFIEQGGKPVYNENSMLDRSTPAIDFVRPSPRHEGLARYISRLLRSVWKSPIIIERVTPTGFMILPSVNLSKLQAISQDLTKLKEFLNANKSFIEGLAGPEALGSVNTKQEEVSLQGEHRALHALVVLLDRVIEGIAFVLVLYDEKIEETILSLANETRQQVKSLSYEGLCTTDLGKALAKDLVKAIVNRNILSGSNVETIAEALRRRCGSFCSSDDVVIFKAQEFVKRGGEAGPDSDICRDYLNESLKLFKQVAGSLSMEQLHWVVGQYIALQFYAGSVTLCLDKAQESDRGNRALTWIQEGRPQDDKRVESFESRRKCYDLIHQVILSIEQSRMQSPDIIDGHLTLSGRRRDEAADEIDNSDDEVFQTDLYDWYLQNNRSEQLLEVESPYVITYLERRSSDEIAHADLLWKYYVQNERYQDAAVVQLALAKSSFKLSLDRRIEYLGNARTNASTTRPGIVRSHRTEVLREISDLLEIANLQSDLLQRLKGEDRINADRKLKIVEELDGNVLPLTVLFNTYCEPAGYFDLCILIYEAADHRMASDIKSTWQNLLENAHDEAERDPQGIKPYEKVAETVRTLGNKLGLSETMFPVSELLPMLKRYAHNFQPNSKPDTWVLDIFIDLQVPFETIYVVIENMFYNDEPPFQGRNRRLLGNDIVYIASLWFQDSIRGSGSPFGGEDNAFAVSQMLQMVMQSGLDERRSEQCSDLRVRVENMLR